jgi:hypothetical protein|tara:strand:+ start:1226 stop:1438 length:213 start_codon:yes stop_codon:yes gene_type:complete
MVLVPTRQYHAALVRTELERQRSRCLLSLQPDTLEFGAGLRLGIINATPAWVRAVLTPLEGRLFYFRDSK